MRYIRLINTNMYQRPMLGRVCWGFICITPLISLFLASSFSENNSNDGVGHHVSLSETKSEYTGDASHLLPKLPFKARRVPFCSRIGRDTSPPPARGGHSAPKSSC